MRFRVSGTNWEGRRFFTAPSITKLAAQIEEEVPERFATDGTVASKGHDQRSPGSDHRPTPHNSSPGVVRALDAGGTKEWLHRVTEALRQSQDRRIKYVIHNGRIFTNYPRNGVPPFTWRPYTGASPHGSHFHISTVDKYDGDVSEWQITLEEDDDMAILTDEEQQELQKFLRLIREENSNVHFVTHAIRLIRAHRDGTDNGSSALQRVKNLVNKLRAV